MEVTPQILHDVDFRQAVRGYDKDEVDEFLERVAVGVGQLQDRLREALDRAAAAERKATEVDARPQRSNESDFDETLKRTLVLAQRTADAAIEEAKEEANQVVSEAREEVERLLTSARQEAEQIKTQSREQALRDEETRRAELLEQITDLDTTRSAMQTDIDVLNRHFDEQRERVRVAMDELKRLIDDPASLQAPNAPEISEAQAPPPAVNPQPDPAPVRRVGDPGGPGSASGPGGSGSMGIGRPSQLQSVDTPRADDRADKPSDQPVELAAEPAPSEPRLRPTPIGLPDEARRSLAPPAAPDRAEGETPAEPAGDPLPPGSPAGRPVEDPDFWKRTDDLTGPNPLLDREGEDEWVPTGGPGRPADRPDVHNDDADDAGGPPTAPVMRIGPPSSSDDAFLDELRKASLGHDQQADAGLFDQDQADETDETEHARRSRFGRRR